MASPRPGGSPGRDALENTASREELEQIDELMYTTQMRELRAIGSGSFGSAVLVEMVVSRERFVAKKIPLEHLTEEDKAKALSEAALLRSLRHDNITEYFGSFVSANTLHILMEYCSGGSLYERHRQNLQLGKPPLGRDALVGQLVLVRVQLVLPHRQPPDLLVLVHRHGDRPPPRARLEAAQEHGAPFHAPALVVAHVAHEAVQQRGLARARRAQGNDAWHVGGHVVAE